MKNPDLSIVVPCYNEEKNIPLILDRFKKAIGKTNSELIIVNNGSRDGSAKILRKILPKYPFARTTHVKKNKGYGFGILSGLKKARGEYLCWTHADLQTNPADVIKAYGIIKKQKNPKKCYVKGNRKRRSLFDVFFTIGMSIFETLILRTRLYDINAQPNLFHKNFFKRLDYYPHDFSFDLFFYYMAKKNKYTVIRFPVLFPKRLHGESSWNSGLKAKFKFIKRTINFTILLKKRMKNR